MKAMIFAAGLGTRLRPITNTIPKAMLPVCGEPLIAHVIRNLKKYGYDDFVVNVHHFPDQIIQYLREQDNFGVRIRISDERDLLRDTGGGLAYAEPLLKDAENGHFLIHNVDILSDLDFGWLQTAVPSDAMATVIVSPRKTSRYFLFNDEMRLVGWTNLSTGEVRSPYAYLDVEACHKYAFAGMHVDSVRIFDLFHQKQMPQKFPIVDFYLSICKDYPVYGVVPPELTLIDVGKLETISVAEEFLKK